MVNCSFRRITQETNIVASIAYTTNKYYLIKTGSLFLDHMLHQWFYYSNFNLRIICSGDLMVDYHHSFEDIGIVLGKLLLNWAKICRYKLLRYYHVIVPMDGSLVRCCIDVSGRPGLYMNAFNCARNMSSVLELVYIFLNALATNFMISLHVDIIKIDSVHHISESIFKALGICLYNLFNSTNNGLSTKGYSRLIWK